VGLPQVKDDSVFLIFASMKNNLEQWFSFAVP
jgi:hypothetical protein